mgnify:FL=1
MAHSKELAKQQGISQEACIAIDEMHKMREQIMARPSMFFNNTEDAVEALHGISFALQWLWGFPLDKKMHKDVFDFEFKQLWAGKKYKCTKTGEIFTIPENVKECDFFQFGEAFIDVGRRGSYCRMSNCISVKD